MNRREIILGGACLGGAALAYGLKPRQTLNLLGSRKMAGILPTTFGGWSSEGEDALVKPETEGKLASLLYSETVSRLYTENHTGDQVMMLVAYGDTQSDLLQLHRPEACYPAVGFHLSFSQSAPVPLTPTVSLPGRRVVAERSDRVERIVYWTRLGEYLPVSQNEQRRDRLLTAMHGFIPDGALFRFSSVRDDPGTFDNLDRFVAEMVQAVPPANRAPLLGSALAKRISV